MEMHSIEDDEHFGGSGMKLSCKKAFLSLLLLFQLETLPIRSNFIGTLSKRQILLITGLFWSMLSTVGLHMLEHTNGSHQAMQ